MTEDKNKQLPEIEEEIIELKSMTLEERLGISEKELANGKSALFIEDPNRELDGVLYKNKQGNYSKLVSPEKLREVLDREQKLKDEVENKENLLNIHRYFDGLRDSIKKQEKTVDQVIGDALKYLGKGIGAYYVSFHLNPEIREQGKINSGYTHKETVRTKGDYADLNGDANYFFNALREKNDPLRIDCKSHKDVYFKNLSEEVLQVKNKNDNKVMGSGFTLYLKPGHDYIGAVQALQTREINETRGKFVNEWVLLADTFICDILGIKVEKEENEEETSEAERITRTFGLSIEDMTGDFVGAGTVEDRFNVKETKELKKQWVFYKPESYFDLNFYNLRERITNFCSGFKDVVVEGNATLEEISKKKYAKSIKFIEDIYRERPEFGIEEGEAKDDLNFSISCMKIVAALYDKFGSNKIKTFNLPSYGIVDTETLETASMFSVGLAKSIKYMKEVDNLPGIKQVRDRQNISQMTSYLSGLIESPELTGEFVYYGEPLMSLVAGSTKGKPSLLGATIVEIADEINPDKQSQFGVDLIEKVMGYVELVQGTSEKPGINVDQALWKMYDNCIDKSKGKLIVDEESIKAINLIDNLVNPEGQKVYSEFRKQFSKVK